MYFPSISGNWSFVGQPRIRTAPDSPSSGNGGGGGHGSIFNPETYSKVKLQPGAQYNPMAYDWQVWKKATQPGMPQAYMRPYMYGYGRPYVNYPTGYVGGQTVGQTNITSAVFVGGLALASFALGLMTGFAWKGF